VGVFKLLQSYKQQLLYQSIHLGGNHTASRLVQQVGITRLVDRFWLHSPACTIQLPRSQAAHRSPPINAHYDVCDIIYRQNYCLQIQNL